MQKVLIVEDSKVVQQILRHLASQHLSVDIDFAWSLKESKALLASNCYTLALVDLTLPDAMDAEVVQLTLSHNVPTVVLTSKIDEYSRQQMLEMGVVDYVIKDNRDSYLYAIKLVSRLLRNQGCKALIADDSMISRAVMRQMLEKQLFTVFEAQDGEQALTMLKADHEVKLLLTDYAMPTMDGFELVKAVRNFRGRDDLAIVGLSGAGTHGLSAKFIKYGANDFLMKPFMNEEFHCRVMQTMEQLNLIAEIKDYAHRDYLTGLYNRRYFCQQMDRLLKSGLEDSCLALLDLDLFKEINDKYGHLGGDSILTQVAHLLNESFSGSLVSRVGGEEFAVLLAESDLQKAKAKFDVFRLKFAENIFQVDDHRLHCTLSIGIAKCEFATLSEVMRHADKALYKAKAQGRNSAVTACTKSNQILEECTS
ncbi:GGDEF domain-containing response regulator [Pseudoalteromonas luteoviolacea]|uniref:diguanylate cyclase n=1 Tax=Pseudoalteromonas luteoviolacea H33 TaxID=1365251 RepID=A0A167FMM3_9GAMM|nr:response regulator [Pseudoalteromonas luteoviolacea]KZN52521.1 diguanylate cyclase [Pseudoalteromonas luteoviolacea H33]KZN76547.1 diguanylate cyclase [Pseudoalteromonas luteoviolacea H33-S]MBQ4877042.1 diguanylate cyclase [Pseudoalteromonas luteoviolacea]MBQ4905903.1 diguanylate cyclase [Pseudoalteromonas luteoviolacea]